MPDRMTSTIKRRIAREWLIFLVCLPLGFITFFLLGLIVSGPDFPASRVFPQMMKLLFADKDAWIAWLSGWRYNCPESF
jgi:uncharacterized membrane protein YesL